MGRKSDDDFQDELLELGSDLTAKIRNGEINPEDARRGRNELQALMELLKIIVDDLSNWTAPFDEAQKLRLEAAIIAAWPEACRRADTPVSPFPADVLKKLNPSTPN